MPPNAPTSFRIYVEFSTPTTPPFSGVLAHSRRAQVTLVSPQNVNFDRNERQMRQFHHKFDDMQYTTTLVVLRTLCDGIDLEKFLDKLNRDFFEKTPASENPALKTAITQKIWETTKHGTVTEALGKL
ncbi:hypothetical protein Trydic_g21204 [Trypoxylus dichotomus]